MFVVTSNQMYQAECSAVKRGTTFPKLMEDAGSACADIIRKNYCIGRQTPAKVLVICGKGKNGGDGFVIARRLWEYGCLVTVMLACGEPQAKDAIDNFLLLESAGIDVIRYNDDLPLHRELINSSDIIVDAVFGTGFSGRLDPDLSRLAKAVNSSGAKKAAVDVPSGANCDSASIEGAVFKADLTIAISAYKPIHIMKPCCAVCGKTVIADIGIEDEDFKALDSVACLTYDARDIKRMLPKRKPVSNKGTYGHALCVCGSMRMTGAACLAVGGALRCGAGLVTAAFPQSAYAGIAPKLTEPLLLPLDSNFEGTFSFNALADIFEAYQKSLRRAARLRHRLQQRHDPSYAQSYQRNKETRHHRRRRHKCAEHQYRYIERSSGARNTHPAPRRNEPSLRQEHSRDSGEPHCGGIRILAGIRRHRRAQGRKHNSLRLRPDKDICQPHRQRRPRKGRQRRPACGHDRFAARSGHEAL